MVIIGAFILLAFFVRTGLKASHSTIQTIMTSKLKFCAAYYSQPYGNFHPLLLDLITSVLPDLIRSEHVHTRDSGGREVRDKNRRERDG